jgi:hypothetical protein
MTQLSQRVLNSLLPRGVQAIAARYDSTTHRWHITGDNGEVYNFTPSDVQAAIGKERDRTKPYHVAKAEAQYKAAQEMRAAQDAQEQKAQAQAEQQQQQQAPTTEDEKWAVAMGRCAELEHRHNKRFKCSCNHGRKLGCLPDHSIRGCTQTGVVALIYPARRTDRYPIACDACARRLIVNHDKDGEPWAWLDCNPDE